MKSCSTIKIEATGRFPDGQPLSEISDRFELRDYCGPVEKITAEITTGDCLKVRTEFFVPDSRCPNDMVVIYYTNSCDVTSPQFTEDRLYWFGHLVRETLRWITLHELDENLRVDGKFFVDPHPEERDDRNIDTVLRKESVPA